MIRTGPVAIAIAVCWLLVAVNAVTCSKTRYAGGTVTSGVTAGSQIVAGSSASSAPSQLTWGCQVEAADGVNTFISWTVTDMSSSAAFAAQMAVIPTLSGTPPQFYYSSTAGQTSCAPPYTGAGGQLCTDLAAPSAGNGAKGSYFQVFTMWGYPCFQGLVPSITSPKAYVYTNATPPSTSVACPNIPSNGYYMVGNVQLNCTGATQGGVIDASSGLLTNCTTMSGLITTKCTNGTMLTSGGNPWPLPCPNVPGPGYFQTNNSYAQIYYNISCANQTINGGYNGMPTNGTYWGAGQWADLKTQYSNTAFLYQAQGTPAWYDLSVSSSTNQNPNPQAWCRSDLGSQQVGAAAGTYLGAGKCSSQGWIQVPSQGTPTCIMVVCLNTGWQNPLIPAAGAVLPGTAPACQVQLSVAVASSLADTLTTSGSQSSNTFQQFTRLFLVLVCMLFL